MTLLLLFNQPGGAPPSGGATGTAFSSFVEAGMFLGNWDIDDYLTFTACTHDDTGAAADADAVPSYAIYEDETAAAIVSGNMAKLGSVTGFYTERVRLTAANGFETGRCYAIRVEAVMGGVAAAAAHSFAVRVAAANVTYWAGQATSHTDGTPDTNLKWINGVQLASTSSEGYLPAEIDAFSEVAIRTAIGLATANMDTQLAAVAKTGADGDTLETLSDQIDAAALEATAQAILEDTGTTLPTAIAAIEPGGGSYAGDGIGYYSDTIDDGTSPLDGVRVQLYTSPNRVGPAYEAYTNALGVFEMWPDPGTYYRWLDLAGYNFSQDVAVTVTEP